MADVSHSPTSTAAGTRLGVILGTAAYMAPEQAAGKTADKRSDLWSFGIVLMEMLTGRAVYTGEKVAHVLAEVLKTEPDWNQLPSETSSPIRRLLQRCLHKDRKRRLDSAGAARLEIDEALNAPASESVRAALGPRSKFSTARKAIPWATALALAAALVLVLARWAPWTEPASLLMRATIELGTDASLATLEGSGGQNRGIGTSAVLSPDGRLLAFAAQDAAGQTELYIRHLDRLVANALPGTEGAGAPFFSADGQWMARHQELVYRAPDNHLMAAPYMASGDSFRTEKPHLWSDRPVGGGFALQPDGDRIAVAAASVQDTTTLEKLVIVTNFFDELRRLAPTRR